MKTLPVGRSTLQLLRSRNAIYVDKTEYIHRLITSGGGVYFLSRPRRFGKSLLIDTIAQLFLGNKELFEGTWIANDGRHDWTPRPVLRLDFSGIPSDSPQRLIAGLCYELDKIAAEYGIDVSRYSDVIIKFDALLTTMSARGRVAVLIDEYDAPIVRNILNQDTCNANREVLKEFYTALKSLDAYLDFVLLTGVSKFSKTSIFSGMNNLKDISLTPEYAAICGYTQEELETCFADYITTTAGALNMSRQQLLEKMRFWYNGYHFSSSLVTVYNPHSALLFFDEKSFSNYWFETGTPTFLVELIKQRFEDFQAIEEGSFPESIFAASEPRDISLIALLYQTGYVTIKEYFPRTRSYALTYPNEEVRQSFSATLLGSFLAKNTVGVGKICLTLQDALFEGDAAGFCTGLESLLASIPYNLHIQRESYYHTILHTIGLAIGGVISESATSRGRIDLVLRSEKHLFVIELKIDASPEAALAQINDRRYYEPFMQQGQTVHLIGLNLAFGEKKLTSAHEVLA